MTGTETTPARIYLLDANVLIAMTVRDHAFHDAAHHWLTTADRVALCPITEGALARFLLREGETGALVTATLDAIHATPGMAFWADDISYRRVELSALHGHQQVTDAYLVALATSRAGGALATFDRALAARHPHSCELVSPT